MDRYLYFFGNCQTLEWRLRS